MASWIMAGSPPAPMVVPDGTAGSKAGPPPVLVPEYSTWLHGHIDRYEALAKTLVEQNAEKGRIVEAVVKSALRAMLPRRFSIGTGFIITSTGKVSKQIDLVLYDELMNTPVILEGGTGLFPIECVYGTVEVKSTLASRDIDNSTESIGLVRQMAKDKVFVGYGLTTDDRGNQVTGEIDIPAELPPRAYIFAIDSSYSSIDSVEEKLRQSVLQNGAHVHGLAVLRKEWLLSQRPHSETAEFMTDARQGLAGICGAILHGVQTMDVGPASMRRYWGLW